MALAVVGMVRCKSSAVHYRLRDEGAELRGTMAPSVLDQPAAVIRPAAKKTVVSAIYSTPTSACSVNQFGSPLAQGYALGWEARLREFLDLLPVSANTCGPERCHRTATMSSCAFRSPLQALRASPGNRCEPFVAEHAAHGL
jgi:hypothetical protein